MGRMTHHPTQKDSQFDLVVLGSGPAGEKGAAQAAYFGKRVCVVERAPKPGGAAVNTGTIPSKTLREAALAISGLRQRGLFGIELTRRGELGVADLMARERAAVESAWTQIQANLEQHAVTTVQGTARFVDDHTVEVSRYGNDPRFISGEVILVATGATPRHAPEVVPDGRVLVDSESVLLLERLPETMVVIGGGAIGCEYACTFAALGSRVTLVHEHARLLRHLDPEASEVLRQQMTGHLGIQVVSERQVQRVAVDGDRAHVTLSDDTVFTADCVLDATGRSGNTAGLGLEALGVQLTPHGFIGVDEHFRTARPNVIAAGDVVGFPLLASTAMEQARVAVCHAFDLRYKRQLASDRAYGVWTIPEIATVGESDASLAARGQSFEVGRAPYRQNARGQIVGAVDGFVKLVFRPEDQRLLGATVVGEGACDLIHVAMTCLALEGTLDFFIQSCFNYPALAEMYKYAAYDGLQRLARRTARMQGLPTLTPPTGISIPTVS
jgi:NAD(P) transhydrogenase